MGRNVSRLSLSAAAVAAARASERERERRETKRLFVCTARLLFWEAAMCLRFRVTIPRIIILINAFFYGGKTNHTLEYAIFYGGKTQSHFGVCHFLRRKNPITLLTP